MVSNKGFFGAVVFFIFVFCFSFILDYYSKVYFERENFSVSLISSSMLFTKKATSEYFASNAINSVLQNSFLFNFDSFALKDKISFELLNYLDSVGFSKIGLCKHKFSFISGKIVKSIEFVFESKEKFSEQFRVLILKKFGFIFIEFFVPENSKFFPCALFESNGDSVFFVILPGFSKSALVVLP
ncbi:MAG: hypothetical protein QXZ13_00265 [Candidatus Diapherotrites archaeon]